MDVHSTEKKKVLKFYISTLKCKFFSGDKPCSTIELLFFSPGYDYSEGYEYANFATHSDVDKSICQQTE